MKNTALFFVILLTMVNTSMSQSVAPMKVGIVGLTHAHVHGILGRKDKGDIKIVGIAEPNRELAERFSKQYEFSMDLVYDDIEIMLEKTNPEAVTAFNNIFDHLKVVQLCAPKGIHVMVEKPLAVSMDHAQQMADLAEKHKIHLLTNYETTWYGSNHFLYKMIHTNPAIGEIRKMVIHDGHPGPIEIGCNQEFLDWLMDPILNGGGAITDFGCYGADLMTWLMKGERPTSVTAITQQIKPDKYPNVDDEATIIVTYPKAQGIIQASWNWTFNRKDTHVYGTTGYIQTIDGTNMRARLGESEGEEEFNAPDLEKPRDEPFAFFEAVVRGRIVSENDLSSLSVNLVAMEILDAAVRSAKSGKTIVLEK